MKNYLAVLTSFVNMSSMLEFNTIVALLGDLETIKHVCVCRLASRGMQIFDERTGKTFAL